MGASRYCSCGAGLDQIEVEDLDEISWDEHAKVECDACGESRGDDTPDLRIMVLVKAVMELRAGVEALKKASP